MTEEQLKEFKRQLKVLEEQELQKPLIQSIIPFPNKSDVLTTDWIDFENIVPLMIIPVEVNGEEIPIPIVFVEFDPGFPTKDELQPYYFNENDTGLDGYSAILTEENKLDFQFRKEALVITDDHRKYFEKGQETLKQFRANEERNIKLSIGLFGEPAWWQYDETPMTTDGIPYQFIGEIDMYHIINDDCRFFIFYEPISRTVKNIYQRT